MRNFVVVIPAYNPMNELPMYVQRLLNSKVAHVVVVNDGCSPEYDPIFQTINHLKGTTVLTHETNQGKGAGLRTIFHHLLNMEMSFDGIVTADADGQHLVKDVLRVGDELVESSLDFVLGVRDFSKKDVPFRSRLGNSIASKLFELLFSYYLDDTQTGLRGIKAYELEWVGQLSGDRFEYEINMLIQMAQRRKRVGEVQIETVYEEDHKSNYSTVKDSVLIGKQYLKGYFKPYSKS